MPDDNSVPNVLFFFTDQQRPDFVGMHPDVPVRTPNLERLAERGVEFRNAICPSPLCAPSRASLHAGVEYDGLPLPENTYCEAFPVKEHPTYVNHLREEAGVHTMGCGKFLDKQFSDRGLDGKNRIGDFGYADGVNSYGKWASAGTVGEPEDPYQAYLEERGLAEAHYEDFRNRHAFVDTEPTPLPEDAYNDNWIPRQGLDLLADAPEDRPWHLQVSFSGPHDPLDVTEDMHDWYRDPAVDFPLPVDRHDDLDEETHQEIRRNYAAMCENIDRWLGRYLDELEARDELDNTLIVFSSDHGEMLGDHGRWKKHAPYQPSVGVPLVIAGPDIADRDPVNAPATILDLHATFLDYAGLDIPGEADSRSLRPVLEGRTDATREVVTAGCGPWRLAFDGRYKLVTGYDPEHREEWSSWTPDIDQVQQFYERSRTLEAVRSERPDLLFDLREDPHETENVAEDNSDVVAELAQHLPSD